MTQPRSVRPTVFCRPRNSTPRHRIFINAAEFSGAVEFSLFALDCKQIDEIRGFCWTGCGDCLSLIVPSDLTASAAQAALVQSIIRTCPSCPERVVAANVDRVMRKRWSLSMQKVTKERPYWTIKPHCGTPRKMQNPAAENRIFCRGKSWTLQISKLCYKELLINTRQLQFCMQLFQKWQIHHYICICCTYFSHLKESCSRQQAITSCLMLWSHALHLNSTCKLPHYYDIAILPAN